MIHRARHLFVGLAALAALSACGSDLAFDDSTASTTGRDPSLASMLLTAGDLDGYSSRTSQDGLGLDEGTGISCLTGSLETATPIDSAGVEFEHEQDGFPAIFNSIATYRDRGEARRLMNVLRDGIAECDDHTQSHAGMEFEFDIQPLVVPVAVGVDDQISVEAQGSVSVGGVSFDVDLALSVASAGRRISIVGVADLDDDSSALLPPYALIAAQRLAAGVRK